MYKINCSYTGYFELPFPFEFERIDDAREVRDALNKLRETFKPWKDLKPFKISNTITNRFILEDQDKPALVG